MAVIVAWNIEPAVLATCARSLVTAAPPQRPWLRWGPLLVDSTLRQAWLDHVPLPLAEQPLRRLVDAQGGVVTAGSPPSPRRRRRGGRAPRRRDARAGSRSGLSPDRPMEQWSVFDGGQDPHYNCGAMHQDTRVAETAGRVTRASVRGVPAGILAALILGLFLLIL